MTTATGTPSGLAVAIAAFPGLPQRLLAEHVDDGTGHCRACPVGNQAGWQRWPCRLHAYAAAAAGVLRSAPRRPRGTGAS